MGRPMRAAADMSVRELLATKLADHVRVTVDPRLDLVPREQRPPLMPVFADRKADMLADLEAGEAVDVWPQLLRGIADVPPGCQLVRVDADGTVSPAPYEPAVASIWR